MTFDLQTGRTDEDANTWSWRDPDESGAPRLDYRQPTVPEYNRFKRHQAAYFDRMHEHMREREDELDEGLAELLDEFDDLDDEERARLRRAHLLSGFQPTADELGGFVTFCVTCTTGIQNIGCGGQALDWQNDDGLVEALPPDDPDACRRRIIESLGESGEQRIASIIEYAQTIAQGLPDQTKKK